MKKNDVEKRIREQADQLTPEPPSFEMITEKTDWNQIAEKTRSVKTTHRIFAPIAFAVSSLLIVGLTTGIIVSLVHSNGYYGSDEDRSFVVGRYSPINWYCTDSSINLSKTAVEVTKEITTSSKGRASLYSENGLFVCALSFSGYPFSDFVFEDFSKEGAYYRDQAFLDGEEYPFTITPSIATSTIRTITILFGDTETTVAGRAEYQLS